MVPQQLNRSSYKFGDDDHILYLYSSSSVTKKLPDQTICYEERIHHMNTGLYLSHLQIKKKNEIFIVQGRFSCFYS